MATSKINNTFTMPNNGICVGFWKYDGQGNSGLFVPMDTRLLKVKSYGDVDIPGTIVDLTVSKYDVWPNGFRFVCQEVTTNANAYNGRSGIVKNVVFERA